MIEKLKGQEALEERFSRSEKTPSQKNQQSFSRPSDNKHKHICFSCGKPGLLARNCRLGKAVNDIEEQVSSDLVYLGTEKNLSIFRDRVFAFSVPKYTRSEKTAFSCTLGTLEYNKMPFGLVSAPATFQRVMDEILRPYLWKFVAVYLDDIIIFSKDESSHKKHVELVMKALEEKGLVLNHDKCEFNKSNLELLGHMISKDDIKPLKSRIEAIKNFELPRTKKQLQSYLGLVNYCRKFIKNVSNIAEPLFKLLRKDVSNNEFIIRIESETCKDAFERINREISKDVMLAFPTKSGQFILTTDASNIGVGAVLSQKNEDKERTDYVYYTTYNIDMYIIRLIKENK